jgi:hypothetical protein
MAMLFSFKRRLFFTANKSFVFFTLFLSAFSFFLGWNKLVTFADSSLTEATGGESGSSIAQPRHPESSVNSGQLDKDKDLNNDYNGKLDHNQAGRPIDWYPQEGSGQTGGGSSDKNTENTAPSLTPAANSQPPPVQPADLGMLHPRQVNNSRMLSQPKLFVSGRYGVQVRQSVALKQRYTSLNASTSSQASASSKADTTSTTAPATASFSMRPH